jgi:hypothetical protein
MPLLLFGFYSFLNGYLVKYCVCNVTELWMSAVVFILVISRWKPCVLFRFHIVCNVSWTSGKRCWHNPVCNGLGPEGTVQPACTPHYFFRGRTAPSEPGSPHCRGFTTKLRHTPHSVGLLWTKYQPDAETSTWQHTTLTKDKTSMPPAGFEPAIRASERPQTYVLECAATEVGFLTYTPL